jgi:hypothetical protein
VSIRVHPWFKVFLRVNSQLVRRSMNSARSLVPRLAKSDPFADLFTNTELAKDATEQILGIVAADDVTDSIESISELNRNELG